MDRKVVGGKVKTKPLSHDKLSGEGKNLRENEKVTGHFQIKHK